SMLPPRCMTYRSHDRAAKEVAVSAGTNPRPTPAPRVLPSSGGFGRWAGALDPDQGRRIPFALSSRKTGRSSPTPCNPDWRCRHEQGTEGDPAGSRVGYREAAPHQGGEGGEDVTSRNPKWRQKAEPHAMRKVWHP